MNELGFFASVLMRQSQVMDDTAWGFLERLSVNSEL